jgi:hypothetical protein
MNAIHSMFGIEVHYIDVEKGVHLESEEPSE